MLDRPPIGFPTGWRFCRQRQQSSMKVFNLVFQIQQKAEFRKRWFVESFQFVVQSARYYLPVTQMPQSLKIKDDIHVVSPILSSRWRCRAGRDQSWDQI